VALVSTDDHTLIGEILNKHIVRVEFAERQLILGETQRMLR
jgi:hypothetical protein